MPGALFHAARDVDAEGPHRGDGRGHVVGAAGRRRVSAALRRASCGGRAPVAGHAGCRCAVLRTAGAPAGAAGAAATARTTGSTRERRGSRSAARSARSVCSTSGLNSAQDFIHERAAWDAASRRRSVRVPRARRRELARALAGSAGAPRREHEADRIHPQLPAPRPRPPRSVMPQILIHMTSCAHRCASRAAASSVARAARADPSPLHQRAADQRQVVAGRGHARAHPPRVATPLSATRGTLRRQQRRQLLEPCPARPASVARSRQLTPTSSCAPLARSARPARA